MKIKGELTISKTSGRPNDRPISIRLIDADSGCYMLTAEMTLENFAEALFGRGGMECECEFNDSGVIGMQAQSKTEMVPVPSGMRPRNGAWIAEALAPFEVEGWKARSGDIDNHHCWSRDKSGQEFQRVVFFRHAPKENPDAE